MPEKRQGAINALQLPSRRAMRTERYAAPSRHQVATSTARQHEALTDPRTDADLELADATIARLKRSIRIAKGDLPDHA